MRPAAAALDARTAAWYSRTGTAVPVGAPTAVDILASFPPVRGSQVFGNTACGGSRAWSRARSREVGVSLQLHMQWAGPTNVMTPQRDARARVYGGETLCGLVMKE